MNSKFIYESLKSLLSQQSIVSEDYDFFFLYVNRHPLVLTTFLSILARLALRLKTPLAFYNAFLLLTEMLEKSKDPCKLILFTRYCRCSYLKPFFVLVPTVTNTQILEKIIEFQAAFETFSLDDEQQRFFETPKLCKLYVTGHHTIFLDSCKNLLKFRETWISKTIRSLQLAENIRVLKLSNLKGLLCRYSSSIVNLETELNQFDTLLSANFLTPTEIAIVCESNSVILQNSYDNLLHNLINGGVVKIPDNSYSTYSYDIAQKKKEEERKSKIAQLTNRNIYIFGLINSFYRQYLEEYSDDSKLAQQLRERSMEKLMEKIFDPDFLKVKPLYISQEDFRDYAEFYGYDMCKINELRRKYVFSYNSRFAFTLNLDNEVIQARKRITIKNNKDTEFSGDGYKARQSQTFHRKDDDVGFFNGCESPIYKYIVNVSPDDIFDITTANLQNMSFEDLDNEQQTNFILRELFQQIQQRFILLKREFELFFVRVSKLVDNCNSDYEQLKNMYSGLLVDMSVYAERSLMIIISTLYISLRYLKESVDDFSKWYKLFYLNIVAF